LEETIQQEENFKRTHLIKLADEERCFILKHEWETLKESKSNNKMLRNKNVC
jgi:hypothetical protein